MATFYWSYTVIIEGDVPSIISPQELEPLMTEDNCIVCLSDRGYWLRDFLKEECLKHNLKSISYLGQDSALLDKSQIIQACVGLKSLLYTWEHPTAEALESDQYSRRGSEFMKVKEVQNLLANGTNAKTFAPDQSSTSNIVEYLMSQIGLLEMAQSREAKVAHVWS